METAQRQRWCLQMTEDISRLYTEISWMLSATPRRRHSRRVGQLTMQSSWAPATICHLGELQFSWMEFSVELSGVELYPCNCVELDHVLNRPDHGFELKNPMPYGRINEWVFSYDGQYVTGWIMGLRWRVDGRWTLWRLVKMTFRELTERQELSRNAAHTGAIMHRVERNGWSQMDRDQMDRGRRRIAAGDGWQEMHPVQRSIAAGYGSRLDMDGWPEVDDRRWTTGDGSRETDDSQSPSFHEDIEAIRSYTLLEISYYDYKLRSYNRAQICRYTMHWRHGSTEYDTEHYSEHFSEIPNHAPTCPSFNAECDPEWDPNSASVIPSHTAAMPIPHISKPYEISRQRSNDL